MHLVDEAGAKALEATDAARARRGAAQKDEPCMTARDFGKRGADALERGDALLGRHRADDAAHDDIVRPTTLAAPVARALDHRRRHAGVHDVDAIAIDAA